MHTAIDLIVDGDGTTVDGRVLIGARRPAAEDEQKKV